MNQNKECLGCRLANKELPVHVVYEDEHVTCLLDIEPFNEGHVLILPKAHVEEHHDLGASATAVLEASMLLSRVITETFRPDGMTMCQNGGVFSDLGHYHLHLVPRYEGQAFEDFYSDAEIERELPALEVTAEKLRKQIEKTLATK